MYRYLPIIDSTILALSNTPGVVFEANAYLHHVQSGFKYAIARVLFTCRRWSNDTHFAHGSTASGPDRYMIHPDLYIRIEDLAYTCSRSYIV